MISARTRRWTSLPWRLILNSLPTMWHNPCSALDGWLSLNSKQSTLGTCWLKSRYQLMLCPAPEPNGLSVSLEERWCDSEQLYGHAVIDQVSSLCSGFTLMGLECHNLPDFGLVRCVSLSEWSCNPWHPLEIVCTYWQPFLMEFLLRML